MAAGTSISRTATSSSVAMATTGGRATAIDRADPLLMGQGRSPTSSASFSSAAAGPSGGQVSPARRSGVVGVPVSPTTRAGTTRGRQSARQPGCSGSASARRHIGLGAGDEGRGAAGDPARDHAALQHQDDRPAGRRSGGGSDGGRGRAAAWGANVAPKTKVDAASKRGATSRSAAATRAGPKPVAARPQRAPAARQAAPVRSVGGGGFQMQSGASARADASRGKSSRSASRGGGGGGGKSGRRR